MKIELTEREINIIALPIVTAVEVHLESLQSLDSGNYDAIKNLLSSPGEILQDIVLLEEYSKILVRIAGLEPDSETRAKLIAEAEGNIKHAMSWRSRITVIKEDDSHAAAILN